MNEQKSILSTEKEKIKMQITYLIKNKVFFATVIEG